MKNKFFFYLMLAVVSAAPLTSCQDNDDNEVPEGRLRILTFEDADYAGTGNLQSTGRADWSSLIDNPQYGGVLLYGASGSGSSEQYYFWDDENNTGLGADFPYNWGSYCFWGGGHAVSNYVDGDLNNGTYLNQLTVYKKNAQAGRTGGGHNGSNNFCIHYGYTDDSPYSAQEPPEIRFADGTARVIDHMYVNNTLYALSCYFDGNGLTPKITDDDWVKIVATGHALGGSVTGTAEFYLCNGPQHIVTEWTKWDLTGLGPVVRVSFNLTGSSVNATGAYSQPAYFAYDDVAVWCD